MFFAIFILLLEFIINTTRLNGIPLYDSCICWVMLHCNQIITCIIYSMGVYYVFNTFTGVIYCMDGLTEMYLRLPDKISGIEEKIKYFEEQLFGANRDFKEVIARRAYHEQNGTMDE